jgi:predicted DNA-binding transcriptional regulator AlpA
MTEDTARRHEPIETIIDDKLYSIEQVADYLGVTRGALATMRYERRGPRWTKISSRVVKYRGKELREWLDQRVRSSTSDDEVAAA